MPSCRGISAHPASHAAVLGPVHDRPCALIAGGSGIVPFRAMLRHWAAGGRDVPARLLYSVRSLQDVIYCDELLELSDRRVDIQLALTRDWPED